MANGIQCDECYPICKRCLRGSRICTWDVEKSSKSEIRLGKITIYTASGPAQSPSARPGVPFNEQRALAFFRSRTATQLSGCHNSSERWYNYLLQVGESEPAIRLGVVAVGALHEEFETHASPPYSTYTALQSLPDSHSAVQKYNKAVKLVSHAKMWQSKDVPLLACTIFASFDTLRGRPEAALFHRCSGLKILSENDFESNSAIRELMACVFIHFDSENMELGEPDFSSSYSLPSMFPCSESPELVRGFVTLKEAAETFEDLFNKLLRGFRRNFDAKDPGIGPRERLPNLLHRYEDFCYAADEYLKACTSGLLIEQDGKSDLVILHLRRLVLRIMLHADLRNGEGNLDRFEPEFECIVTLAECFTNGCMRTGDELSRISALINIVNSHVDLQLPIDDYFTPERAFTATGTSCGKQMDFLGIRAAQTPLMKWGSLDDNFVQSTLAVLAQLPVYNGRSPTGSTDCPRSSFSLAPGIVKPLWITAVRCREPTIRRRALTILETTHRKEGQWDSLICAANAKLIIEAEERKALEHLRSASPEAMLLNDRIYHSWQVPNEARLRRFTAVMNDGELKPGMKRFEWRAVGDDWWCTVPGCTTQ